MTLQILDYSDNFKVITHSMIGGIIYSDTIEYIHFIYDDIEFRIKFKFMFNFSWRFGLRLNDIVIQKIKIKKFKNGPFHIYNQEGNNYYDIMYEMINKICLIESKST